MTNKQKAAKYIDYHIWRENEGRKIADKYRKEGLSEEDAMHKASEEKWGIEHPDQDFACFLDDEIKDGSDASWDLLKTIIDLCPYNEDVLGHIGAGPFEDWIKTLVPYLEHEMDIKKLLENDKKWRIVVGNSWNNPKELDAFLHSILENETHSPSPTNKEI